MHSYVVCYGNQLILRFCFIFGPTKHALNFGIRRKGYTQMISNVFIRWLLLLSISSMVLTLIGLRPDLKTIRDQILGSFSVPSLDDVFAHLLGISSTPTLPSDNTLDFSVGNRGRGQCPHCTYCNKLGHTRDRCYQLHGRPPLTAHVAQSFDPQLPQPPSSSTSQGISLTDSEYDDYLRYQATKSTSIASIAQTGNASACLTHTSSLGPWILDSGTSDHISGNKDFFSSITTTSALPIVTLANGSQTMAKGFGFVHPLPSVPLHYVLYAPECPFNLISISKITRTLNCSITFSDKFTIGIGHESQGLYHLTSPSTPAVCISIDAPLLIHSCLGHPSLSKFQKMLGKHTRVSFPKRLNNRAKSHFELVHTDGDVVLTTCYLINRMPSSVLHDQIPHSLLFPDQPLYFLPPRVFGCICFDIPNFKRVIVVIPLKTHRYFLSADITFFEDSPFFSTSKSLPVSECILAHFRFIIVVIVSLFLFLWLTHFLSFQLLLPRLLPPSADLPIALRKDLVVLPSGKSTIGCRWVYTVKVGPDGQVDRLKVYGSDYGDTFSLVAKIASVRLLLSMAAMRSWPLYQLDIKNAFLHGDLAEEVYMEQPPGFVAQGEYGLVCRLRRSLYGLKQSPRAWFSCFSSVVQEFGMFRSTSDHSCIYLVVYVDDIVITGSDQNGIQKLKQHLFTHFQTKNLGKLKYFLGIEIAQSSSGVVLSQRKYALNILEETGMLDCKLNYLTITRLDISFPVSVVSQFLQSPCDSHWDAVIRILRYIKSTPGQGVLYENRGHAQVVGYTDADWAGSPIDRHSIFEYCMKLIRDNQAALHIASNPVFHERTKHIEVDCHSIREKITSGCVVTSFVNSNDQLADTFTKSLRGPRIKYICNKLGAYNIYAPA
uniref:Uncharacterized protein n=1 Tax=Vitis vinifera TaxID=29760 RepID=A5C2T9_VITVI|nr:hypothetical protein VITISV_014212 [Vitis vinifera]